MEAQYDDFEIARVIPGFRLIDSESYERRYFRRDGAPLPTGYYVVHWPSGVRIRRFDTEAVFYGAFGSRQDAQRVLNAFLAPAAVSSGGAISVPEPRSMVHEAG